MRHRLPRAAAAAAGLVEGGEVGLGPLDLMFNQLLSLVMGSRNNGEQVDGEMQAQIVHHSCLVVFVVDLVWDKILFDCMHVREF